MLCGLMGAVAQEPDSIESVQEAPSDGKFEIRISVPQYNDEDMIERHLPGGSAWNNYSSEGVQYGDRYHSISPCIGFTYSPFKHMDIVTSIIASNSQQKLYDKVTKQTLRHDRRTNLYLQPTVRWNAYLADWLKLYFGFGFEVGTMVENGDWEAKTSFSLVEGLSVGKKIFGFCEFYLSNELIFTSLGVGYRF